jgi:hypothetical protein
VEGPEISDEELLADGLQRIRAETDQKATTMDSLPATPLWRHEYFKSHSALTLLFRQIDEQFRKCMCWFLRSITIEKEDSGGPDAEIARPAKRTPFRPPQHSSSVHPGRGSGSCVRRCQTAWLDDLAKHGHGGHATSAQVTGKRRRRRADSIHWREWLVTRQRQAGGRRSTGHQLFAASIQRASTENGLAQSRELARRADAPHMATNWMA